MKEENKKQKVAVFDIDGTIFRSSLLFELTEALVHEKVISKYARSYYQEAWEKWQARAEDGDYDTFINGVVQGYLKYIKGVKRSDVWRVAEKIIERQKLRTYRYTRDLVEKLKDEYFMLAISQSVEKENLPRRGSRGVGDTESDLPFLKLVSKPIAFNPSSGLYRVARREGWGVVVERKDVIYKL